MRAYADRSAARRQPVILTPRNIKAAQAAREQDVPLVISFIGDAPWGNPTVYCDSGQRYDWGFVRGLRTLIAVRPAIDLKDALAEIHGYSDTIGDGYPVLADVEAKQVACVVEGAPVQLWHIRSGSDVWQQYFEPQT